MQDNGKAQGKIFLNPLQLSHKRHTVITVNNTSSNAARFIKETLKISFVRNLSFEEYFNLKQSRNFASIFTETTENCLNPSHVEIIRTQDTIQLGYQSPEFKPLLCFPFTVAFSNSGNTVQFCFH